jgi:hypothetical protein
MTSITALLHTQNDALRLGRCLETLYPCDRVVIVDHGSHDGTRHLARDYGARIIAAVSGAPAGHYFQSVANSDPAGWILCLDPHESLSESLAASLYEWKSEAIHDAVPAPCSVFLREETAEGWVEVPTAQTRLVPGTWDRWVGNTPVHDPSAIALEGELLRFVFP